MRRGRNREKFHNNAYYVTIKKWAKRRKLRKKGQELLVTMPGA